MCRCMANITLKLFADDAKLYSITDTDITFDNLQSCLNELFLSEILIWKFMHSPSKCAVTNLTP